MKRLIGSVTVLLVTCCYLWSCEKDDICAESTPTTPQLQIEFYSDTNHSAAKLVTGLQVFLEGTTDTITLGTVDAISLPLLTNTTSTRWGLIYNKESSGLGIVPDTDYVQFKYTTREEYVSRACGYKVLFTLDDNSDTAPNPSLTDAPGETSLWIRGFEMVNKNIETEDDVHVKIFF